MINDAIADPAPLGIIAASGPDAGDFLRAQLTNDVARLGSDRHFLAAWCDAKGRVLMLARVTCINERYLLIVPRALIASLMQRLRMYILRARVDVADVSDEFQLAGLLGSALPTVNQTESRDEVHTLGLEPSGDGQARALLLASADRDLPGEAVALGSDTWQLSGIDAGVPQIVAATQNEFVPQMLNLHWLLAVDFGKGCYPGQEVVARLHYRGRLTRRVYRLQWQGQSPEPGAIVCNGDDTSVGMVLQSAPTEADQGRLLAVVKTQAAGRDDLRCGATRLSALELPYPTPDQSSAG